MTPLVLCFHVHQPYRLRPVTYFDVGSGAPLFDDLENRRVLARVAERCYLPANRVLLELARGSGGRFRCAFSLSGTVLRQLEEWRPDVLDTFRELVATGAVELVCETSHHSLAAVADPEEFQSQVADQRQRLRRLFGVEPATFRDTELVLDSAIARAADAMGFDAILAEGAEDVLGEGGARRLHRPSGCRRAKLLPRDPALSDEVAFRFADAGGPGVPLRADDFAAALAAAARGADLVGLFLDYETFGEHLGVETGILAFLGELPRRVLARPDLAFATPREVAACVEAPAGLAIRRAFSWADEERDLSPWLGNAMQRAAHEDLYALREELRRRGDPAELLEEWRRLSTSDHLYYMSTKGGPSGAVHASFRPYDHPHGAYVAFANALEDLAGRTASAAL